MDSNQYSVFSTDIDLQITTVQKQMTTASREKDFVTAAHLKKQLNELKEEQLRQHERALDQKHADEQNALTLNYENEFRLLNENWDDKMQKFCDAVQATQTEMLQRHSQEQEEKRKKLEAQFPVQPKFSPKYLSLCRSRDVLAKDENFTDAILVEQEIKALNEKETTDWAKARELKISKHLENLAAKQRAEHESYLQKSEEKFSEMKKQRAEDVEEFLRRFQNLRREMEIAHRTAKNLFEGKHTTGAGKSTFSISECSRALFSSNISQSVKLSRSTR
mmetsp:Transcript_15925/g.29135  ORF Transcript_15925/g.29135 Transcript_15925/m.29135 type:complete len:277 (+) Transcript_15925:907-1737(+)